MGCPSSFLIRGGRLWAAPIKLKEKKQIRMANNNNNNRIRKFSYSLEIDEQEDQDTGDRTQEVRICCKVGIHQIREDF